MSSKRKKRKVPMNPDSGMDDMDRGKAFATRGLREAIGTFVPMEEWGEVYASIGRAVSRGAKEDDAGKLQVCKKYPALTGPMEKALQKAGESEKRKKRKSPEARLRALDRAFTPPGHYQQPEKPVSMESDSGYRIVSATDSRFRRLRHYIFVLGDEGVHERAIMGKKALDEVGMYHEFSAEFMDHQDRAVGDEDRQLAYCLLGDLANGIGSEEEAASSLRAIAERNPGTYPIISGAIDVLSKPKDSRGPLKESSLFF
jgi:hypothetical protein